MNTRSNARDFFLHLGAIAAFYLSVGAFITLLFKVINTAYPKITGAYFYYNPSIGLQVAMLLVFFPIFLGLAWLIEKDGSRDFAFRKWLTYITIFLASLIIAIDLVSVLYFFLDGQELSKAFLLKALTLLLVSIGVFGYFFRNLKDSISSRERIWWRVGSSLAVVAAIVLGFSVIGTPATQRDYRYDMQRVTSLQNLQWGIVNYWQMKEEIPTELADLNDSIRGNYDVKDPKTGELFKYEKTGNLSFKLCANFSRPSGNTMSEGASMVSPEMGPFGREGDNWNHPAGEQCFERTIDPDLYAPVRAQ